MAGKKILILSVSAGTGHMRAAEALREAACGLDDDVVAEHVDVMDFATRLFKSLYADLYAPIVKHSPLLWEMIYKSTDHKTDDSPLERMRVATQKFNTLGLFKYIKSFKPDAVVCTHFLPAELLSGRVATKKSSVPCWVQVTDYDVHSLWIHPGMTGYFVATDQAAWKLKAKGIPASSIHVTGIPISSKFLQPTQRAACSRELGFDPGRPTVLLMSGGMGKDDLCPVAERILALSPCPQVIALAGKNRILLGKLDELASRYGGRLVPVGFTDRIETLMAAADIAVTKPGGLTTAECLTLKLPMILVSPIPGQEERNADYLIESGAALKALDLATIEYKITSLLTTPARLAAMRGKASASAHPNAAPVTMGIVISHLAQDRFSQT